jgi:Glycolipid 2-alpha-mannosyltransferase
MIIAKMPMFSYFRAGDYNSSDLDQIENSLGYVATSGDIFICPTPSFGLDPKRTQSTTRRIGTLTIVSEGYRRMMHWFAIDLWDFVAQWNEGKSCQYRYLFRLDEDSFIHSPIKYDIMRSRDFVYGFRMCAYEMALTRPMATTWAKRYPKFRPQRPLNPEMYGFYSNFFVADLHFFRSPKVAEYLAFVDKKGRIYKWRLGDLMVQSMAVYWFVRKANPSVSGFHVRT